MLITKKSPFTGKINTLEINVTPEQLDNYYQSGEVIQQSLFWLTPDEREFIMTGITPDEWPSQDIDEVYLTDKLTSIDTDEDDEWEYWFGSEPFASER